MAVFDLVYDIIENSSAAKIRLGDDEAAERVTEILDRDVAAEDRAKELLEPK